MTPGFAVSFTYSDFYPGTICTMPDLETALGQYSTPAVIRLCSHFNQLRESARFLKDPRITEWMVKSAFVPDRATKILAGRTEPKRRFVFHRPQLLLIIKAAASIGKATGGDPVTDPNLGTMGDAFLLANELLKYDTPRETEEELESNVLVNFVAIADHLGQSLGSVVVRSVVSTDVLEQYRNDERFREFVDLPAKFESDLRMTISEYRAAILVGIIKYVMLKADDITVRGDLIDFIASLAKFPLSKQWFGSTLPPEKVESFLADTSATAAEFVKPCSKASTVYDFTPFRDKPLLKVEDEYYPVDTGFLADKLETGPFWPVQQILKDSDRLRSLAFWGRIFEGYISWLLTECLGNQRNVFLANPLFRSKKNEIREICDGFVKCGSFLAMLECKGGFFDRAAKYGGNAAKLRQTIEEKLIKTGQGEKRGIEQLLIYS